MTATLTAPHDAAATELAATDRAARADVDAVVSAIRSREWIDPLLAGRPVVPDTTSWERSIDVAIAQVARVDPRVAAAIRPLQTPVAQLIPASSTAELQNAMARMQSATSRAGENIGVARSVATERWQGKAGESLQGRLDGLQQRMGTHATVAAGVSDLVTLGTEIVHVARFLTLTAINEAVTAVVNSMRRNAPTPTTTTAAGQTRLYTDVTAAVHRAVGKIQQTLHALVSSSSLLAALADRLNQTVARPGTGSTLVADRVFVGHPSGSGKAPTVTPDWPRTDSRTGGGSVYRNPKNQEEVRVMPRGRYNPDGYTRYRDSAGRYLDSNGNRVQGGADDPTGTKSPDTHIDHHYRGPLKIPYINNSGPMFLLPNQEQWLKDRSCEMKKTEGCPGVYRQ